MLSCRGSTREFYTASSTATRQREYRWVMTSTSQNYKNTVFKHLDLAPHKQQKHNANSATRCVWTLSCVHVSFVSEDPAEHTSYRSLNTEASAWRNQPRCTKFVHQRHCSTDLRASCVCLGQHVVPEIVSISILKKKEILQTSYQTEPQWHTSTWVSHDTPWASMGHIAATDICPISRLNALTCVKFEVHFLVPQMFLLKIFKLQGKNSLQILGMKPLPQRGLKGLLHLPLSPPTPKVMSEMLLKVALWCFHSSCTSRDF